MCARVPMGISIGKNCDASADDERAWRFPVDRNA